MALPSTESAPSTLVAADAGTVCALDDPPPARAQPVVVNVPPRDTTTKHSVLGLVAGRMGLVSSNSPWRSPWRVLLSHAELKRYFIGSVASDFGTWIQNTAQVLLAYKLTHSALAVGLVTCAQFSSPLVLGPWAGVLANRLGSKPTLLCTQVLSALMAGTLGILQFTGSLTEPYLIAGAMAIGLFFTFALPARTVTVRTLVPEKEVKAAMAMDSVSYNLGRALAPVLSVAVIISIGFGWAFEINAVSFIIFSIMLLGLPGRPAEPTHERSPVLSGFKIAWQRRRILILLLMVASVTVAADPVLVLGPALAYGHSGSARTYRRRHGVLLHHAQIRLIDARRICQSRVARRGRSVHSRRGAGLPQRIVFKAAEKEKLVLANRTAYVGPQMILVIPRE